MLQVVVPGLRHGHQFKAGENLLQGTVAYISGMNTDGYMLLKTPATSTNAALAIYPFIKYPYRDDLSDYSATAGETEVIASGDPLIAFEGGEYITDRFITAIGANGPAIGSHTTSPVFFSGKLVGDTGMPFALVTDTAAYSEGQGKIVYLWPSTAAATKGYLRVATAGDTYCQGVAGSYPARYNKNFQLIKVWSRGYSGWAGNKVQFRIVGRDAYSNRFWTGFSTAAYANIGAIANV